MFVGDLDQKMMLYVTTESNSLALISTDCSIKVCNVPSRYDENDSTENEVETIATGVHINNVPHFAQTQSVLELSVTGNVIKERVTVVTQGDIATNVTGSILKIMRASPSFKSSYSGYLGLAPWKDDTDKKYNFVYSLK